MAVKSKDFEEAIRELESIVDRLEHGELTLDESIKLFRDGVEYSRFCAKRLDEVEKKITVLIEDGNGAVNEEEFKDMDPVRPEE